jgi:hypothetical protein
MGFGRVLSIRSSTVPSLLASASSSEGLFMVDWFHSPRLTLVRAEHHIREFNETVNGFIAKRPWTSFVDKDSEPGRDLHKVKLTEQLLEMLPCILFDATNNLRAVLHQIGYACAMAAKSPSLKAIKFPFGPTEDKFRNNLAGGCKDLPSEICAIFEGFKAYQGGNDALWATNEIANANKHFALRAFVLKRPDAFFSARIEGQGSLEEIVSPGGAGIGWDSRKNEITLVSAPAGAKTDISVDITAEVAVEGIQIRGCDAGAPSSMLHAA